MAVVSRNIFIPGLPGTPLEVRIPSVHRNIILLSDDQLITIGILRSHKNTLALSELTWVP